MILKLGTHARVEEHVHILDLTMHCCQQQVCLWMVTDTYRLKHGHAPQAGQRVGYQREFQASCHLQLRHTARSIQHSNFLQHKQFVQLANQWQCCSTAACRCIPIIHSPQATAQESGCLHRVSPQPKQLVCKWWQPLESCYASQIMRQT